MYNASRSLKNGGYLYVNQDQQQQQQYQGHDAQTQQQMQNLLFKQQQQMQSSLHKQQQQQQKKTSLEQSSSAAIAASALQNAQQVAQQHQELTRRQMEAHHQKYYGMQHQQYQQYFNSLKTPRTAQQYESFLKSAAAASHSGPSASGPGREGSNSFRSSLDRMQSNMLVPTTLSSSSLLGHVPGRGVVSNPGTPSYSPRASSSRDGVATPSALSSTGAPRPSSTKPAIHFETPLDLSVSKEAPLDLTVGRKLPSADDDVILTHVNPAPSVFRTPSYEKPRTDRTHSNLTSMSEADKELWIKKLQEQALAKQQYAQKHSGTLTSDQQRPMQQQRSTPDRTRDSYDNAYRKHYGGFLPPYESGARGSNIHITKAVSNGTATIKADIPFNIPQTEQENNIVRVENRNQAHLTGGTVHKGGHYPQQPPTQHRPMQPAGYYQTQSGPRHISNNYVSQHSPASGLKNLYRHSDTDTVRMPDGSYQVPTAAWSALAPKHQHQTPTSDLEPGEICRDGEVGKTVTVQQGNFVGGTMHTLPTGVRLHRTQESIKPFHHEKHGPPVSMETDPNRIPVANVNPIINPNRNATSSKKQSVYEAPVDHAMMMERSFRTTTPFGTAPAPYNSALNREYSKAPGSKNEPPRRFELPTKVVEISEKEKVMMWLKNIPDPIQLQENPSYTSLLPQVDLDASNDIPDGVTHTSASCSMTQDNNKQSSTTGSQLPGCDAFTMRADDASRESEFMHRKRLGQPRIMAPLDKKSQKDGCPVKQQPAEDSMACYKESITDNYLNSGLKTYHGSPAADGVIGLPPPTEAQPKPDVPGDLKPKLEPEVKIEANTNELKRKNTNKVPRSYKKSKTRLSVEGKVVDAEQSPGNDLKMTIRLSRERDGTKQKRGAGRRSITPYNKNRAYERELCKEERRHKLLRTKRSHQPEGAGSAVLKASEQADDPYAMTGDDVTCDSSDTEIDEPICSSMGDEDEPNSENPDRPRSRKRHLSSASRGSKHRHMKWRRRPSVIQQQHFGARKRRYNIKRRPSTGLKTTLTVVTSPAHDGVTSSTAEALALRPALLSTKAGARRARGPRGPRAPRGSKTGEKGPKAIRRSLLQKTRPSSTPPANKPHYEHDVVAPSESQTIVAPPGYTQLLHYSQSGKTILHNAVQYRDMEVLQYCLSANKTPVSSRDHAGLTALHDACIMGDVRTVEMLLGYGADLDALDTQGLRPLHHASRHAHLDLVRLLLSYGDDVTALSYDCRSVLNCAGSDEMTTLLTGYLNDLNGEEEKYMPWSLSPSTVLEGAIPANRYDVMAGVPSDTSSEFATEDTIFFEEYAEQPINMYKLSLPETNMPKNYFILDDVTNVLHLDTEEFRERHPTHYITKIPLGHFYSMTAYIRIRGVFNAVLQTVDVLEATEDLCRLMGGTFQLLSLKPGIKVEIEEPEIKVEPNVCDDQDDQMSKHSDVDVDALKCKVKACEVVVEKVAEPASFPVVPPPLVTPPRVTRSRTCPNLNSAQKSSSNMAISASNSGSDVEQHVEIRTLRSGKRSLVGGSSPKPSASMKGNGHLKGVTGSKVMTSDSTTGRTSQKVKSKSMKNMDKHVNKNCDIEKNVIENTKTVSDILSKVVENEDTGLQVAGTKPEDVESPDEVSIQKEPYELMDLSCHETLSPEKSCSKSTENTAFPSSSHLSGSSTTRSMSGLPPPPPLVSDADVISACVPKHLAQKQQHRGQKGSTKTRSGLTPDAQGTRGTSPVETGDVLGDLKRVFRRRSDGSSSNNAQQIPRNTAVAAISLTTTIEKLAEKLSAENIEPPLPVLEKQQSGDNTTPVPSAESDVEGDDPEMPNLTPASVFRL